MNDVVPQRQGVAQILKGQGMLTKARLAGEAGHIAQRQHQVIVLQGVLL